ncbi:MAG: hypothetical protein ABH828_04905 [archaeon]
MNNDLDSKIDDIKNAYAGKIIIDRHNNIKHKIISMPKMLYFGTYKIFLPYINSIIGEIGRKDMINQGVLNWYIHNNPRAFLVFTARTKKDSPLRVFNTLIKQAEEVSKIKGETYMAAYSETIPPAVIERFGWETEPINDGYKFEKHIAIL